MEAEAQRRARRDHGCSEDLKVIPQRNISLLSNRLAREGGRRIPEAVLERDYCLA